MNNMFGCFELFLLLTGLLLQQDELSIAAEMPPDIKERN
jgi:hypothetical protein